MSFTRRIRLFLVLIATMPLLMVMVLIWYQLDRQDEQANQRLAQEAVNRFQVLERSLKQQLERSVAEFSSQASFQRTVRELTDDKVSRLSTDPRRYSLDFAEIIRLDGSVGATYHRPGLLGRQMETPLPFIPDSLPRLIETVEYDLHGPHAAIVSVTGVGHDLFLYAGRYIDTELLNQMTDMTGSVINLAIEVDTVLIYASMERQKLYRTDTGYEAVLAGSDAVDFFLVAEFDSEVDDTALINLLGLAALVGLMSVVISIAVGMYITGRASREIENLVQATERVSKGDLNTPIMAYEEGEFSKLADSFSKMIVDLKHSQAELAESEKIAAWQTMGRKIAHEIKNPMTPIAISAEDLRRSYHENLPDFGQILDQTTGTIKSEVDRLARLLDQFVNFARMAPPIIKPTDIGQMIDELRNFYQREITDGRLAITVSLEVNSFAIDRDNIWQVMINLIKNGLESDENSKVSLEIACGKESLVFDFEDNGPGFPEEILADSFQPHISRKKHGSGLGLVICHRIIRDHGGELRLYNLTEGGAGIKVIIPA